MAMGAIISRHNLDFEALMPSRLPWPSGTHVGDPLSLQLAGSSQVVESTRDSKAILVGNGMAAPSSVSLYPSAASKVYRASPNSSSLYPVVESGSSPVQFQFGSFSYDNYGSVAKVKEDRNMEACSSLPLGYISSRRKAVEHDGRNPYTYKLFQDGVPNNASETGMLRNVSNRDGRKSLMPKPPISSLPFKEQHLEQLRFQYLVFLAFKYGVVPKKLHLEMALGHFPPKDDN